MLIIIMFLNAKINDINCKGSYELNLLKFNYLIGYPIHFDNTGLP